MTCDEVGRQEEGARSRSGTGIPYIAAISAANPPNREEPVNRVCFTLGANANRFGPLTL